jgi:hypothetical protein
MIVVSHLLRRFVAPLRNGTTVPALGKRYHSSRQKSDEGMHMMKAGLPLILFCGLGVWVVANGIEGKNKERDLFQGRISK